MLDCRKPGQWSEQVDQSKLLYISYKNLVKALPRAVLAAYSCLLVLDQEKAHDRVSHDVMWEALGALGIPQRFISWVRALYRDAAVNLYVNVTKAEIPR